MIRIVTDFNDFSVRHLEFTKKIDIDLNISFVASNSIGVPKYETSSFPFTCHPSTIVNGVHIIAFNAELIQKCELSQSEIDACLLYEVGHIIHYNHASEDELKRMCNQVVADENMSFTMFSALLKIQEKLGVDLHGHIDALSSVLHIFRPEWTCGRYNEYKQVALMYNLIAGFSYFFEEPSAVVIGEILKTKRNEKINISKIESATGICTESLVSFITTLVQCGLLTDSIPTSEGIQKYRLTVLEERKANLSQSEKNTKEKLPMVVSNAEQAYFSAVDDGKTICSCMFELTYRCSEMCIHCYNPGATRNNTEVNHRADQKELTLDDYKHIIDDMCENGLVKVCLSGGDPFSKEFTWELLDYLYMKGIAVDVFTNGQRIIKDIKRLANYYPRLVGVSIYSGIADDHDTITRIPGSWKKSMQVVKELYEFAIPMNLKCCIMQPNLHSYYMVADIAQEYGAIPQFEITITESNDGDLCAKQLRLTEEQLQVVLRDDNLMLYVGKEAPNYGGQKRDLSSCSCGAGGTGFCMSPNGDLRGCVAFTQSYGNLQQLTVKEILNNSSELKEWRCAVIADYTECGRYDYCDYCNLCAGVNYTEHGDFRKPAETNCYMAKCRYNLAHKLMENESTMTRKEFVALLQKLPIENVELRRKFYIKG